MNYKKQIIGHLEKCYAISRLDWRGRKCLLVAAEKRDPCYLFSEDGTRLSTVWDGPGGVMTMVPFPGKEGAFLATQQFYSPNDAKSAGLIYAEDTGTGWRITRVCDLPFVHRFAVLSRNGINYIIACTLKTDHEYKDDWRFPGKVWVGILPEPPELDKLELTPLREGFLRNHGFTLLPRDGYDGALISCENGIFLFEPPAQKGAEWSVKKLLDVSASDAVGADLDGDGKPELFVISPFHGSQFRIYRLLDGAYREVYEHPAELPFLHAIDSGVLCGRPAVLVGNREGDRSLLAFFWRGDHYEFEEIDHDCGPANCMIFETQGRSSILAANRECSEIAIYHVEP